MCYLKNKDSHIAYESIEKQQHAVRQREQTQMQ